RLAVAGEGPVGQRTPPDEVVGRHETPLPAVETVVSIVAHHEVLALGNRHRAEIVEAGRDAPGILVDTVRLEQCYVPLVPRLPHVDHLVDDLERLPGEPDDPLDVILALVLGIAEDHDITPRDLRERQEEALDGIRKRREAELVHEDMVPDQKRILHRRARDLERLEQERADEEGEHEGDDRRLRVFEEKTPRADRNAHTKPASPRRPRRNALLDQGTAFSCTALWCQLQRGTL